MGGLYDLSTDPSEDHDVSQTTVQARDAMTARLSAWLKRNPAAKPAEGDAPSQFKTLTADNGTEFHDYESIERATRVTFYFATPYHPWERGSASQEARPPNAGGMLP